jgi:hypothetical protein
MNNVVSALVFVVLAASSHSSVAEDLPLFADDQILKAVLSAPIAQSYSQKNQEVRIYLPGQWSYTDADGETQRLEVSIRTRGHFRRFNCGLSPLQLNFKKKQVKGTLFDGQDKLKLVAPCYDKPNYQQYVLLEYLAYRTFEILTDHSFRTRLMRLTYLDSDAKLKPWTHFVFVIEDDADLAERLGLVRVKVPALKLAELDHSKATLVQLFQFLIGNNDYSLIKGDGVECCHNIEVLGAEGSETGRVPVPFDFDISGLVEAPYASPPSQIPIESVRSRYFYGLCQPPGLLEESIAHMQSKRAELTELFESVPELDARSRDRSLSYLRSFFKTIDNPGRVKREIENRCRGRTIMETMLETAKGSTSGQPDSP